MKIKFGSIIALYMVIAAVALLLFFFLDRYIVTDETWIDYFAIGHFCVWTIVGLVVGSYAQSRPKKRLKVFGITLSIILLIYIICIIGVFWEIFEQTGWGSGFYMTPDSMFNVLVDIIVNMSAFSLAFWLMVARKK